MGKLDYDLILNSSNALNCLKQRELDLRHHSIQQIENLILTKVRCPISDPPKNQNDILQLSDNSISKLDNIPLLPRLTTLLLSNNKISSVDPEVCQKLPNLSCLILTNNHIQNLSDLDALSGFKKLEYLSLYDNPVSLKKHYRDYCIFKLPFVRYLDYKKVTQLERVNAAKLFAGDEGKEFIKSLEKTGNTFVPGQMDKKAPSLYQGPTPEEKAKIKVALKNAKTLEEITLLERQLETGQLLQR